MAAHPALVRSYVRQYSPAELRAREKVLADYLGNPDTVTSETLAEVGYSLEGKSRGEIIEEIETVEAALKQAEGTDVNAVVSSRFIDMSSRPIE